jgi:ribosomal 50S subunit-associated protein YjgA (DUF615 family)
MTSHGDPDPAQHRHGLYARARAHADATERADLEFLALLHREEAWRAYLLGETDGIVKDAVWAAPICDLDASVIRGLPRNARCFR